MSYSFVLCFFVLLISLAASAPVVITEGNIGPTNITEATTPKSRDDPESDVDLDEFGLPGLSFLTFPLMSILGKNFNHSSMMDFGDSISESHRVSSSFSGLLGKGEEPFRISSISAKKQIVHVSKNGSVDSETSSIHLVVKGEQVYELDYPDSSAEDDAPQGSDESDEVDDVHPHSNSESPPRSGKAPLSALADEVDHEDYHTTDSSEDLATESAVALASKSVEEVGDASQ
ncbi:uncharacterized protein LOC124155033 [Ischnura elegans]|uniref:uncharacterized protein LOC124155033 n=1 Tax=Ischnura elegans TaxID=197161 RepID=UPI001ED89AA4|nr:uncharacterized protein LOC124155033 [Ischnura elegans]